MIGVFVFILGLIVGSFLNAVIYRLSVKKSALIGRSFCPRCKHELAAKDLVPLFSFLSLEGKCRYCRKPISWQYPLVELATGICFYLLHMRLEVFSGAPDSMVVYFIVYGVFIGFLVVIFVYDLLHYLILDKVVVPAVIIAVAANLYLGIDWKRMLVAAVAAAGFFAAQFVLSRGTWIGGGDIRLGFLMGCMLSWPQILVALFLAYLIGSVVSIGLLASKKKRMGSKVPFGTFLTVATFITLLYGAEIIDWYLQRVYL